MKVLIVDITGITSDLYPFKNGEAVLCLGEIENMPGHVAVVHKNEVLWGFHEDNFRAPRDGEL